MAKGIFLTGTGTDIGKTYIAGLLVKTLAEAGKHPAYYKAAMSGNDRRPDGSLIPGDGAFVKTFSGIGQSGELLAELADAGTWLDGQRFSRGSRESDIASWIAGLNL